MNTVYLAHVIAFSSSSLVCFASVSRARRIEHRDTRQGMIAFLLSTGIWSGGYVGYLLAPIDAIRLAFFVLGLVFALLAVVAWLYFAAAYTGRNPRNAPYRTVGIAAVLGIVLVKVFNPGDLYYTTAWTTTPFPHLAISHGLIHWLILGASYALIAVGFFMLLERFYFAGANTRPLVILVALTGLPIGFNIVGAIDPQLLPMLYEPIGVSVFAVGVLFVFFDRFQAIQLAGGVDEPAVFLDRGRRIREFNQLAAEQFPELVDGLGQPLGDVVPTFSNHLQGEAETVEFTRNGETIHYRITTSPFGTGGVTTGKLLTFSNVTDEETYRKELETKSEQLEALNRVIRHDIRNDMTVVVGWAKTLEDAVADEDAEALDRVVRAAKHAIGLTETARDFVDVLEEAGGLELDAIDLESTVRHEIETLRDSYPDASVSIDGDIPSVSVEANEMLSSVFGNLLGNAVQHNDMRKPEITVRAEASADTVTVRIADNGPGIPDDMKERVFGKGEIGLESEGTGIGLYLVRTLVNQFNGTVWVGDNEPEGAIFVVELQRVET
ncbi:MAG: ATP-binding protein [Natronomonas sp.]